MDKFDYNLLAGVTRSSYYCVIRTAAANNLLTICTARRFDYNIYKDQTSLHV